MIAKLYSIFNHKCPRCLEGDIYANKSSYDLKNITNMKHSCDKCELDYEREPGYYYGAMYVSYALGVAVFVTIWASCNWFFDNVGVWTQISLVLIALIGLGPYLYALSKVIWANFFFSYKANATSSR